MTFWHKRSKKLRRNSKLRKRRSRSFKGGEGGPAEWGWNDPDNSTPEERRMNKEKETLIINLVKNITGMYVLNEKIYKIKANYWAGSPTVSKPLEADFYLVGYFRKDASENKNKWKCYDEVKREKKVLWSIDDAEEFLENNEKVRVGHYEASGITDRYKKEHNCHLID